MSAQRACAATKAGSSRLHQLSEPLLGQAAAEAGEAEGDKDGNRDSVQCEALALQFWILVACQDSKGLRDKPGKSPDFYHTCYCLSGLSVAQHLCGRALGGRVNAVAATDPRINVLPDKLRRARDHFARASSSGLQR